jgi:hypothetical protein
MAALAAHQAGSVKLELRIDQFRGHPGQEFVTDRAADSTASCTAQPIVSTISGDALELDSETLIGLANFV